MNNSTRYLLCTGFTLMFVVLATSGCATKGYVRAQAATNAARISAVEAKANEQIARLGDKEQTDISRVEEQIKSTDSKVAEVATVAQQANASASQANQLAQQNQSAIATNTTALATLHKTMSFEMVAKGDVTFGFNKSTLGKTDEAALDVLIQQVQARPRAVFELLGFTDPVGSKDYNLALSRRRAESVARYLVRQGVPLRGIHIIGLGKEAPPASLVAELQAVDPNASQADSQRLARRVLVRVYTADASLMSANSVSSGK